MSPVDDHVHFADFRRIGTNFGSSWPRPLHSHRPFPIVPVFNFRGTNAKLNSRKRRIIGTIFALLPKNGFD